MTGRLFLALLATLIAALALSGVFDDDPGHVRQVLTQAEPTTHLHVRMQGRVEPDDLPAFVAEHGLEDAFCQAARTAATAPSPNALLVQLQYWFRALEPRDAADCLGRAILTYTRDTGFIPSGYDAPHAVAVCRNLTAWKELDRALPADTLAKLLGSLPTYTDCEGPLGALLEGSPRARHLAARAIQAHPRLAPELNVPPDALLPPPGDPVGDAR